MSTPDRRKEDIVTRVRDMAGRRLLAILVVLTFAGLTLLGIGFFSYRSHASSQIEGLGSSVNGLVSIAKDNATRSRKLADQVRRLGGTPVVAPGEDPPQVSKPGSAGPAGPQGLQGVQGFIGIPGIQGPRGLKGSTGDTGATGQPGIPGSAGSNGLDGINGSVGSTGPAGPAGPAGPPGKDGQNGTNGKDGAPGANGANGSPAQTMTITQGGITYTCTRSNTDNVNPAYNCTAPAPIG